MTARQRVNDTLDEIKRTIQSMAQEEFPGFSCSKKNLLRLNRWPPPRSGSSSSAISVPSLASIRDELGNCQRCKLSKGRRKIVFGRGNPGARLVFVGEAPGREEDRLGEPFVGPAGQLLTKIIQAMELSRDDVYILNVIKCRPPQNRNPLPEEVDACSPFMTKQIRSIQPDYICALGKFAAQTLLQTDRPISRVRGRFYDYQGIQMMPTFHPSYLLHNPEKKRDVWQDMKKLMAAMKESK